VQISNGAYVVVSRHSASELEVIGAQTPTERLHLKKPGCMSPGEKMD
jgi:hypothetical protein